MESSQHFANFLEVTHTKTFFSHHNTTNTNICNRDKSDLKQNLSLLYCAMHSGIFSVLFHFAKKKNAGHHPLN